MNLRALAVAMFAVGAGVVQAGEVREVRGRVIDEKGRPVAAADVSYTWRANGPANDKAGKPFDLSTVESQKAFWGHVGEMAPFIDKPAKTGPDGRFLLSVRNRYFFVMAMDEPRQRGGLAFLPHGEGPAEIEIRLGPLVRVKGSLEGPGPGEHPSWTHVYTLLPDDPTRPLGSTRLVSCGSFEANFAMSLPPGRYFLNAYRFRGEDVDQISEIDPPKENPADGELARGRPGCAPAS